MSEYCCHECKKQQKDEENFRADFGVWKLHELDQEGTLLWLQVAKLGLADHHEVERQKAAHPPLYC